MNLIGIVKEIDKLGRVHIPKDFRDALHLFGEVEILLTNEGILIRNPDYMVVKNKELKK